MKIGITGTDIGPTDIQVERFVDYTDIDHSLYEFHHGMCEGVDEEFGNEVFCCGARVIGHPGVTRYGRIYKRGSCLIHEEREPKQFLKRNKDIVDETDELWAFPKEMNEIIRSGTWSTIRYARKQGKKITIFWPDGTITNG